MANQAIAAVRAPRMVRVAEAARLLHVHPNTLRKWSSDGLIASYRMGQRRDRRFTLEDLARFLTSSRSEPTDGDGLPGATIFDFDSAN